MAKTTDFYSQIDVMSPASTTVSALTKPNHSPLPQLHSLPRSNLLIPTTDLPGQIPLFLHIQINQLSQFSSSRKDNGAGLRQATEGLVLAAHDDVLGKES